MLEHENAEPRSPERVVVIGAGGFVGGAVALRLAASDIPVVKLTRAEVDLLAEGAADTLAEALKPGDAVVVVSALAPCKTATQLVENVRMIETVAAALAQVEPSHVVYISSDAVYSDDANPVNEESPAAPSSLHGAMHLAREVALAASLKVPLAILRPSLLHGAADPHNGYGPNRYLRLAAGGETITLFGEGEEKRDHVYIEDVAELVHLTLAHRSRGVLNIATGISHSFRDAAEIAVAATGGGAKIQGTPRQNPITHRHFDVSACLKAFPRFRYTPLETGIARTVESRKGES